MGLRGRKSAASLSLVTTDAIARDARAEPPDDLTDEQRVEWLSVVNRLPADWFPRETHSVLAQYCRHVVAARRVAQLIDAAETSGEDFDVQAYDRLLKMQEREGRAMSSLATRMRLTQQSTYEAKKKKPTASARPWDFEG